MGAEPQNLSYSDPCAKQQRALQRLKKENRSTRCVRSLADLRRQLTDPSPYNTQREARFVNRDGAYSLCSDNGSDRGSDISLGQGDSAISVVRGFGQEDSRAHEACLVALTELRRDADLHCKELKKVLKLQRHEIETLRRRWSLLSCAQ